MLPSPSCRRRNCRRALRRAVLFSLLPALLLAAALPLHAERKIVKRVPPQYPPLAQHMDITGTVELIATVAPSGSVTAVKVKHGNVMLVPAAKSALLQWKYAAASAASTETVNIDFELSR
jgi:TonB family protein